MKKTTSFFILFIVPIMLLAQSGTSLEIIPPSPEASNIAKYADVPVSLFTGKPQINFPLYTLKCGNIELPISLSYYASGIRIEDYPTWAGIGWALNAGGVIARTIRGPVKGIGGNILGQYLPITYPTIDDFYNLVNLGDGNHNTQSDIFHYNFGQFQGSFQVKDNAPILRKHENLRIEFPTDLSTITITDPTGNKYYFEPTIVEGSIGTDYYLVKIESVNKVDFIYFEYIPGDNYVTPPHNSDFYSLKNTIFKIGTSSQHSDVSNSGKLLRKIYTSNSDSIVFVKRNIVQPGSQSYYNTNRQVLDSIVVYNINGELLSFDINVNNVQTIKPYSKYLPSFPALNTTTDMNYRLYLDGFDKIDKSGNIIMSYSFDYYGRTNDGRDSLANRYSFAQDFGGFYNGQNNNNSLVPSFNQTIYPLSELDQSISFACVDFDNYISNVNIPGANRDPNLEYMRMGTLKSIRYPTGGYARFYYSQMENPIDSEPFWGLKIDKIEYLNSDNVVEKSKQYIYSQPVLGYPIPSFWHYTFFNLNTNQTSPFPYCDCLHGGCPVDWGWAMELSPNDVYDFGLNDGPLVGYGYVKEIEEGNGHTSYTFSIEGACYDDYPYYYFVVDGLYYAYSEQPPLGSIRVDLNNTWPLGPAVYNNWNLGTLINKSTYSEANLLRQSTDYHYSYHVLDTVPGIKIYPVKQDFCYVYYQFNNFSIWEELDSITEVIDDVFFTKRYSYNEKKQVSEIEQNSSNGKLVSIKYKYPSDINTGVYASMNNLNMLNYPIEETYFENGKTTGSKLTTYKSDNGNFVPDKIYSLEPETPLTSFSPFTGTSKDPNYGTLPEATFDDYDNVTGRPLQLHTKDGITTAYIWDSTGAFPVARIVSGASFTVSSTVQTNIKNLSFKGTDIKTDVDSDIYDLSTQLASFLNNKNYRVTLYTYAPLVGMTSQTDPNGVTTYYEYDDFGRLKNAKNDDNAKLQEYNYHYRGN